MSENLPYGLLSFAIAETDGTGEIRISLSHDKKFAQVHLVEWVGCPEDHPEAEDVDVEYFMRPVVSSETHMFTETADLLNQLKMAVAILESATRKGEKA